MEAPLGVRSAFGCSPAVWTLEKRAAEGTAHALPHILGKYWNSLSPAAGREDHGWNGTVGGLSVSLGDKMGSKKGIMTALVFLLLSGRGRSPCLRNANEFSVSSQS